MGMFLRRGRLTRLADFPPGHIIELRENGTPAEFYLAKHDYEPGLNGAGRTLVVRKDCYTSMVFSAGAGTGDFPGSDIDNWLNGEYIGLFDSRVQAKMGITKFYYAAGGAKKSTMERKAFLLSAMEFGRLDTYGDGSTLPADMIELLSIAQLDGTAGEQWTRTLNNGHVGYIYVLNAYGKLDEEKRTRPNGARPCFTLPSDLIVSGDRIV